MCSPVAERHMYICTSPLSVSRQIVRTKNLQMPLIAAMIGELFAILLLSSWNAFVAIVVYVRQRACIGTTNLPHTKRYGWGRAYIHKACRPRQARTTATPDLLWSTPSGPTKPPTPSLRP